MRALAAALLLGVAVLAGCGGGSVRDYVQSNYERQSGPGERPAVYRSDEPPSRTAADIAEARRPGDRRVTESGVFLRYQRDFVGVVPDRGGGSRVLVDDQRHGYGFFFPYVGGFWGRSSGRGESFRGGGPGAGK